jgi:hypothetical protein
MPDPQSPPQAQSQREALEQQKPASERAPKAEEHPTQTWTCENPRCRYVGKKRTVRLQHLGAGLYLRANVICFCGRPPILDLPSGRRA